MNVYNAIMKAADKVEQEGTLWRFDSLCVPPKCGSPACALGWIGFFFGMHGQLVSHAAARMGVTDRVFYDRMDECAGSKNWIRAEQYLLVAKALRVYADKYHGDEKPKPVTPDWNALASQQTVADHVRSQEIARV